MLRLSATLLLVLAVGCGGDSGGRVPPVGPVVVPNVTGMTVEQGQRSLRDAWLGVEMGETLLATDGVHFRPVRRAGRIVVGQTPTAGVEDRQDSIVALTTELRGEVRRLEWDRIAFDLGRVMLRFSRDCVTVDHVQLAPPVGRVRIISVWGRASRNRVSCKGDTLVLRPASPWTRETIGAFSGGQTPDPALRGDQVVAPVQAPILQPDRRTVLFRFSYGGCHDLAGVRATLTGTEARVRVVLGTDPGNDSPCPLILSGGYGQARLPAPAPPGTTFG